jgi:phage regulator Rha-like protein
MLDKIDAVIENKIHLIRGHKVMLDRDLAELFGVETRALKQQVKRNMDRFPLHFVFELSENEADFLVSQNVIPSKKQLGGALPYVFTEHGVLMLANVLKSKSAIEMSVKIIDVFVKLRELIISQKDILLKLELLEKTTLKNSKEIQVLFNAVKQLIQEPKKERTKIGFKISTKK